MKVSLFLPGLICIAPLAAQITLSPSQGPKGKPITATVSVPGAISYYWSFGPGVTPQINSGQGTAQLVFTPQTPGAIDIYCDVVTTASSMRLRAVAAIEIPPTSGGLLSITGPCPAQPGDPMGFVPRFCGGSGVATVKDQSGTILQTLPISPGIPFWVSAPTASGTRKTIYVEFTGPGGTLGPLSAWNILAPDKVGTMVQPSAVTAGTVANTIRLKSWQYPGSSTLNGSDYRWDSITGGTFTSQTPYEAKFMVTAAPGGAVDVMASYYKPKTASNPAGRVSVATQPPIPVLAAPDATIECDDSTVLPEGRNIRAEIPLHPFFPNPGDPYGFPKRLFYSWTISGGVLKSNGGRQVMFDITAQQGEHVTLRCVVTNDAGTSVTGEKVFTLE